MGDELSLKVKLLLGFLSDGVAIEGPGEVFHQINTEEFGSLDSLHGGSVDVQTSLLFCLCPGCWHYTMLVAVSPPFCNDADSLLLMKPNMAMSTANLMMWVELCIAAQSSVSRVNTGLLCNIRNAE